MVVNVINYYCCPVKLLDKFYLNKFTGEPMRQTYRTPETHENS